MSTTAQPFFLRGPSALARLTAFGLAALVLMFIDSRFRALDSVRSVISTVVHPLQQLAMVPVSTARSVGQWFESRNALQIENEALRATALENAQSVQGRASLMSENAQLRALLALREKSVPKGIGAEILQSGRDPFSQRVIIDRGAQQGVKSGFAVVDSLGVIGQVTRAHPLTAEVTLVTEKDHAIPVRNQRTGQRHLMFGVGGEQLPELRFVAAAVDIQVGDVLTTSGLDGIYPADLAVARVAAVAKDGGQPFLRVRCLPLAGVASSRHVLVIPNESAVVESPPDPNGDRSKGRARVAGGRS
jgi:rod shape-determining protein MreC